MNPIVRAFWVVNLWVRFWWLVNVRGVTPSDMHRGLIGMGYRLTEYIPTANGYRRVYEKEESEKVAVQIRGVRRVE